MIKEVKITETNLSLLKEIRTLIKDVFDKEVSSCYNDEGIREFYKYLEENQFLERHKKSHYLLVKMENDKITGVCEIRNENHISLLFVHNDYRKQGIGKELFESVKTRCKQKYKITVNSSPNSLNAYKSMGFVSIKDEQEVHGIKFTPMEYIV